MATLAILGAGAALSAGAGIYGASQAAKTGNAANQINAQNYAENHRVNTANALQDAINSYENQKQRALDNQRYDEAQRIEQAQRELTNKLATATTIDQDGNTVRFDRNTGTWTSTSMGVGRDNLQRQQSASGRQYDASLVNDVVGGQQLNDRRSQGGHTQLQERLLGNSLLGQYGANQGRSTQSLEGALIGKNVAEATDALQRNGGMAQLQGWRQGNSGSDALIGALARTGQTGTRSAIASAQADAPLMSMNERDASAKSILAPATTLNSRGNADPGTAAPVFTGSASGNLLAGLNRGNAAGVGTSINPRAGSQLSVNGRSGANAAYTPLNANGNAGVGVAESLRSILNNKQLMARFGVGNKSTETTPVTKPDAFGGVDSDALLDGEAW